MNYALKTLKQSFLILLLIFNSPLLMANWDPEICWWDDSHDLSELLNPKYVAVKHFVTEELKNSWCSKDKVNLLMDLVLIQKPKICVEIGAFTGSSVLPVASVIGYNKFGKVFAIDAWDNEVATMNMHEDDPNKDWWLKLNMDQIENTFDTLMEKWKLESFVHKLKMKSNEAVNFVDEIDFLHIDGDYSESGSIEDINLYLPKVKSGGYILISNVYLMVNEKQPKLTSFHKLLEECEMIWEIDNSNAVLFRKF